MDGSEEQISQGHKADRQAREVFRYFQPTNPAAFNEPWLPIDNNSASIPDILMASASAVPDISVSERNSIGAGVFYSPNTTLTSFAHLAALHLNAQRAFITYIGPFSLP
jgi:hypothetical protein